MTDLLDRIRETALALPEVEERPEGDTHVFYVAGEPFVRVRGDDIAVRGDGPTLEWIGVPVKVDPESPLVDDRIARSWELTAPARLLEAGGR